MIETNMHEQTGFSEASNPSEPGVVESRAASLSSMISKGNEDMGRDQIGSEVFVDSSDRGTDSLVELTTELNRAREDLEAARAQALQWQDEVGKLVGTIEELKKDRGAAEAIARLMEEDLAAAKTGAESLEAEIAKHKNKLKDSVRKLRAEKRQHSVTTNELGEMQQRILRADKKITTLQTTQLKLEEQLQASGGVGEQLVQDDRIRRWLVKARRRSGLRLSSPVVTIGSGPIAPQELNAFIKSRGLKAVRPGTPSSEIMVVGRTDWLVDDLEDQIRARQGRALRVYSEEMFIAALATGDDPFTTADLKTLLAFAKGHPALEYLIEAGFEWPVLKWATSHETEGIDQAFGVKQSPIHHLGYSVGKVGLADRDRRALLERAFRGKLPIVHSKQYMATWGSPESRIRLRRMARHVAWLARLWQNQDSHHVAVSHWSTDLAWMHNTLYESWMRFRWPAVIA